MMTLPVLALVSVLAAAPAPASEDHPLVSRYEGSKPTSRKVEDFGRYSLATRTSPKGDPEGEVLEGKVTRIVYENPAGRSTLEIFRNYREALEKAGATVVWTCEMDACGPSYARSAWNRYNGLFAAADGDPRYLAAKIVSGGASSTAAYVAVMVGKRRTQVDVVELQAMETDKVVADAAALGKGIDAEGGVSVYGIYFDTDKSDVKAESGPALEEIAKLLKARPALKLYVVGHTDMTGALAHNMTLSQARARAVVDVLVKSHGIAAGRLEGHGVGPLAPVAVNTSEAGRAKNRRVELVAR
jgi:outer membrane protein OmpA-like peptidoglycan-associated protein